MSDRKIVRSDEAAVNYCVVNSFLAVPTYFAFHLKWCFDTMQLTLLTSVVVISVQGCSRYRVDNIRIYGKVNVCLVETNIYQPTKNVS